jgi:GntR family transcriptional regulator / MocR family aminotransferase
MDQLEGNQLGRRMIAAIKEQIHKGVYLPGNRLPSTRAFAAEWGASRTTVTAAFGQLIAEGYLASRPGARAVVANGLITQPKEIASSLREVPRLSSYAARVMGFPRPSKNEPAKVADFRYGNLSDEDFPTLPWRRALNKALLKRRGVMAYDSPQGTERLRKALQGYLWRARGISCSADQIIVVGGSQQAIDLCARVILDPGDKVVIENPCYLLAREAFVAIGAIPIDIEVDEDGLKSELLSTARLSYVTPSHQYPMGSVLSATRRRHLVSWAIRESAYILEDDYDSEYRHGIAPIPTLQSLSPEHVIYVGTLSKTLSPTLRLGYIVAPSHLAAAFAAVKRLADRHTSLLLQDALAEFIESGAHERHIRSIRRQNADRKTALLAALGEAFGSTVTIAGFDSGLHVLIWLHRIPATHEAEVVASARASGIGVYPVATLFAQDGPRPSMAGLILGYAGLSTTAIKIGAVNLANIIATYSDS